MVCVNGFTGTRGDGSDTRRIGFITLGVVLFLVRSTVEKAVVSMLALAVLAPTTSVFSTRGIMGLSFTLETSACVSDFNGLGLNPSVVGFAVLS